MFIDEDVKQEVKLFLLNYAEEHGSPDPSGKTNPSASYLTMFLPADMSYKSVHRDFVAILKEDDKLKSLRGYGRTLHLLIFHPYY
jgi:hypothetical protein